jgi:hypothetical protein
MHRFPEVIEDKQVDLKGSSSTGYRRLCRIVEPYSRSIINQFGLLFSSVGLPDEQVESVQIAADITFDKIKRAFFGE